MDDGALASSAARLALMGKVLQELDDQCRRAAAAAAFPPATHTVVVATRGASRRDRSVPFLQVGRKGLGRGLP